MGGNTNVRGEDRASSFEGRAIHGTSFSETPTGGRTTDSGTSADETVDVPGVGLVSSPAWSRPATGMTLRNGDVIPGTRLKITGWLGRGSTSDVYQGRHIALGRPLAIKLLRRCESTTGERERFLAEARLAVELDSQFIVDVVDFGHLEDGRPYYAMERLGPRSLEASLRDGPLPVARTLSLLRMACKGVGAVHRAGFVHRDVKPANLVFVERSGRERLVLVDLGLAVAAGPLTSETIAGTPAYMAPEQIRGDLVDERTDIYALGCCAYEMLCGPRFSGEEDVSAVLASHLVATPPEFPADGSVPDVLRRIVLRCLAHDPEDRFASTAELELALCEAQLALDCSDDDAIHLELPDVDEDRRRELLTSMSAPRRMPLSSPTAARPWRRGTPWLASLACVGLLSLFGLNDSSALDDVAGGQTMSSAPATTPPMSAHALEAQPSPETTTVTAAVVRRSASANDDASDVKHASDAAERDGSESDGSESQATATPDPAEVVDLTEPEPEPEPSETTHTDASRASQARPADPRQARRLVRKARRAQRGGEHSKALALFEEAIEYDEDNVDAYEGIASIYEERNRFKRAQHFARISVRKSSRRNRRNDDDERHSSRNDGRSRLAGGLFRRRARG